MEMDPVCVPSPLVVAFCGFFRPVSPLSFVHDGKKEKRERWGAFKGCLHLLLRESVQDLLLCTGEEERPSTNIQVFHAGRNIKLKLTGVLCLAGTTVFCVFVLCCLRSPCLFSRMKKSYRSALLHSC